MPRNYFQDELNYLRILGKEYAERHPEAHFLGTGAKDPDVERLFQGFAFLTGRLHERLDDRYSEIAEGFLHVLWPEALKPIPSVTMIQFEPDKKVLRNNIVLESGLPLFSNRHSWGVHEFRTTRRVDLYPFRLTDVHVEGIGQSSILKFRFTLNSGASLEECTFGDFPIWISGDDPRFKYGWYQWLTQYATSVKFVSDSTDESDEITLTPIGFGDSEALFPDFGDEIPGHRILKEYLAFPGYFLSVNVGSLDFLKTLNISETFELQVHFKNRIPDGSLRDIKQDAFRIYCCPAVNLFDSIARLPLDHTRSEYVIRSDEHDIAHHEIYSIKEVIGTETGGTGRRFVYRPYFDQRNKVLEDEIQPTYRLRFTDIHIKRDNRPLTGRECFISFDTPEDIAKGMNNQSISLHLICTHRSGATDITPGDLCQSNERIPAFVKFKNYIRPTPMKPAPMSPEHLWFLVSSFAMSRQSVASLEQLKSVITFHARGDGGSASQIQHLLDGLYDFSIKPGVTSVNGTPLRTLAVTFVFDCDPDQMGEFYMFGVVISEFMRHIATINTRLTFEIKYRNNRDTTFIWPHRSGTCPVL